MMPAQEGVRRRLPRIAPAVKNAAQRARQVARNVSSGATRLARARQERLATVDLSAAVLLLGCAIVLPLFTFAVAYSISHRIFSSYPEEDRWPKGYFISAALDLQPASNFGAFFLTVALASTVAVAVIRHMIVARRLPAGCEALHRTSLFLSLASALGGNGVAAFPHNSSRAIHNTMAALFFLGNLFHFWIETLLEFREPLGVRAGQSATRFWHTAICALALVFTAVFLGHILGEEMGKLDFGIGKFTAALAEIATVACFLVYIGTYYRSFAATRITFAVEVNTDRSDPVWSDPLARQGGWSPLRGSRPPGGWSERGGGGLASPGGVRRSLGTPRRPSRELLDHAFDAMETIAAETLIAAETFAPLQEMLGSTDSLPSLPPLQDADAADDADGGADAEGSGDAGGGAEAEGSGDVDGGADAEPK